MRSWLRFADEPNGYCLAFEIGQELCPIVYDQHDWFDTGTGFNGDPFAESLSQSWCAWASICFQSPSWWADLATADGIDWASDEFHADYRIPSATPK